MEFTVEAQGLGLRASIITTTILGGSLYVEAQGLRVKGFNNYQYYFGGSLL